MANATYHSVVAVGPSPSLPKVDRDERPHSHDVVDYFKRRRHRQLSCSDGTTRTGTRHHPVAMLCRFQPRDNKFRHRERIRRSKDGRRKLFQTSLQETPFEDWVLNMLAFVPTSQILAVSVNQHMPPTGNSNKGRQTTQSSHN